MVKSSVSSLSWPGIALSPLVAGIETPIIQALLCSTDHGILMSDHRGTDILCNPRFGELFDIDPQLVVHSTRDEVRRIALTRVKDPEGFAALIESIYADPLLEYEDEIELNSTPPRFLRRYTGPVFDSRGQNIGRVWTFKDVTETRRLQTEVQSYAKRLEAQFAQQAEDLRATNEVLAAMTAISAAIAVSPDLSHLVAAITRTVSTLLGSDCAALLLKEGPDRLCGAICRADDGDTPAAIALKEDPLLSETLCNEPSPAMASLCAYPSDSGPFARKLGSDHATLAVLRREGEPIGVLAWGAANPLEPLRRQHLQAVADQVALALKTYGLQSELRAAYEDLRSAHEQTVEAEKIGAVGTLAVSIAQEIRNMMTPLQMELSTAHRSAALSAARVQINRLCALTHRLLALRSPTTIYPSPVDINDLLQRLLPLVHPQAEVNGVEIRTHFRKSLPPAQGDAGRLEHLFITLFLNALHAMAERGGKLTVSTAADDGRVRIDVKDTGKGIAPEHLPRLFDPFFSTRPDGAGLGLFSAKRIVEEHQGRIQVTSRPEKGTCISVWLPTTPSPP